VGHYTPDRHYYSVCCASFSQNEVLILFREATSFNVSKLSFLAPPKTLPTTSEKQALFITENSSLVIADSLANPNFQAVGTLKEEIENRFVSEQQSFQKTLRSLSKFVSKPIPLHSVLLTEKSDLIVVLKA
jgi:hypothetical protein